MTLLLALFLQLTGPESFAKFHEERIARLAPGSKEAQQAHQDLGLFWLRHNDPVRAEIELRQAPATDEVTAYLAEAVAAQGRLEQADQLFQSCQALARCLTRLAERASDPAKALDYYRRALDTEPTPVRRNDYAQALHGAGKLKEAEALYRLAIAEQLKTPGPNHPETAITQNNLASLLTAANRLAEAEPLQRQAYSTMRKTLGPRHVRTGLAASNLADLLRAKGGAEPEASRLYREALAIFEELLPPNHPWTLEARQALTKP